MDNNAKIVNQNSNSVFQDQAQPQAPIQPSAPVGIANKEMGPISSPIPELKVSGPDVSHEISQELKDIGIETKSDNLNLTQEHKSVGIDHAGPHVPIPTSSSGSVKLPMTETEMLEKIKTGSSNDSGRWFASLMKKVIAVMNFGN